MKMIRYVARWLILSIMILGCDSSSGPATTTPSSSTDSTGATVVDACTAAGTPTSHTSVGSGSVSDPYMICNASQLNSLANSTTSLDKAYKLDSDIDGSGLTSSIGASTSARFKGVFDGNSKKVTGMTRPLFGYTHGAIIKSLTLENVTLSSTTADQSAVALDAITTRFDSINVSGTIGTSVGRAAGFVTNSVGSFFYNTHNTATVTTTSAIAVASRGVGGLVGVSLNDVFLKCSNTASITGSDMYVGGIVGSYKNSRMMGCYSSGGISGRFYAGGVIGYIFYTSAYNDYGVQLPQVYDSYATGNVTASENYAGGLVGYNYGTIKNVYATGDVSGKAGIGGLVGSLNTTYSTVINGFSTGNVTVNFTTSSGTVLGKSGGTITNVYGSAESTCNGSTTACVQAFTGEQALSTDFQDESKAPLTSFDFITETANGINDTWHTPNGALPKLWWQDTDTFSYSLSGSGTSSSPYLVASTSDWNVIRSNPRYLSSYVKVSGDLDFTGVTLEKLEFGFGGVLYGNSKTISNVTLSAGEMIEALFAGSYIQNLTISSFTGTTNSKGSLLERNQGYVSNVSVANSSVSGADYTGGLASFNEGYISGSNVSSITIVGSGKSVGGLVGQNNFGATIISSYSTGTMSNSAYYTGGLVGRNLEGTISKSYSTVPLTAVNNYAGGLVGENYRTNSSTEFDASISNSYAQGAVSGSGKSIIGGLVGRNYNGSVDSSYSTGNVTCTSGGGFVGYNTSSSGTASISNSFSTGDITANGSRGRLVGVDSSGSYSNNYVHSGSSCSASNCTSFYTGSHANLADFYSSANAPMSGWDFTTIWVESASTFPSQ